MSNWCLRRCDASRAQDRARAPSADDSTGRSQAPRRARNLRPTRRPVRRAREPPARRRSPDALSSRARSRRSRLHARTSRWRIAPEFCADHACFRDAAELADIVDRLLARRHPRAGDHGAKCIENAVLAGQKDLGRQGPVARGDHVAGEAARHIGRSEGRTRERCGRRDRDCGGQKAAARLRVRIVQARNPSDGRGFMRSAVDGSSSRAGSLWTLRIALSGLAIPKHSSNAGKAQIAQA